MSKFDRCIFISIAIGICALAMTQVFQPEILQSATTEKNNFSTLLKAICPKGIENTTTIYEGSDHLNMKSNNCYYSLFVTFDEFLKNNMHFD